MRAWTRVATLLFVLTLLAVKPTVAQNSLNVAKVDAAHHTVEFENDEVRVVRWVIPPGDKTANHSHPNMVSIYLTDANGRATTPDGKSNETHAKAGAVAWRKSGTHIVENIGTQPMMGILVEPKKPSSALPAGAQDVLTADAKHSKLEFENDQVRVIRYHLEPGEKSPMHGHPDTVQVLLSDSKTSMSTADGKTSASTGKAGDARWRPVTQHIVENTGSQPLEVILVEMK